MVQITGRLMKDAEVKQLQDDATVVNFTIAVSEWHKPKNGDGKELTEFIQCGYWMHAAIAKNLKKGAVVEAGGRLFSSAYMRGNDPVGQINLFVQHVKVLVFAKKEEPQHEATQPLGTQAEQPKRGNSNKPKPNRPEKPAVAPVAEPSEPVDDLPF